jgi:hypothetical protein
MAKLTNVSAMHRLKPMVRRSISQLTSISLANIGYIGIGIDYSQGIIGT